MLVSAGTPEMYFRKGVLVYRVGQYPSQDDPPVDPATITQEMIDSELRYIHDPALRGKIPPGIGWKEKASKKDSESLKGKLTRNLLGVATEDATVKGVCDYLPIVTRESVVMG